MTAVVDLAVSWLRQWSKLDIQVDTPILSISSAMLWHMMEWQCMYICSCLCSSSTWSSLSWRWVWKRNWMRKNYCHWQNVVLKPWFLHDGHHHLCLLEPEVTKLRQEVLEVGGNLRKCFTSQSWKLCLLFMQSMLSPENRFRFVSLSIFQLAIVSDFTRAAWHHICIIRRYQESLKL